MVVNDARNPQWGDAGNTYINLEVQFVGDATYYEFTASPLDPEAHGVDIYNRAVAEEWGTVAAYS